MTEFVWIENPPLDKALTDRVKGLNLGADDYLRSGYKNCDKSWKRDQFVVKRIYGVRMSDAESEYRDDEAAD